MSAVVCCRVVVLELCLSRLWISAEEMGDTEATRGAHNRFPRCQSNDYVESHMVLNGANGKPATATGEEGATRVAIIVSAKTIERLGGRLNADYIERSTRQRQDDRYVQRRLYVRHSLAVDITPLCHRPAVPTFLDPPATCYWSPGC